MFNKAWIQLAIILIPIALIFDVQALLVLSAFLLGVLPIAWWWNRQSLSGVGYERTLSERRAFPGETVKLTLRVTNQKLLPLGWLSVDDQWSTALPMEDGVLFASPSGQTGLFRSAFSIRWFERISRHYRIRCTRRGFYPFGPARLSSGDIWGLFRQSQTREHLDWLIVYPQVLPLGALGFPPKEPLGETKAAWRIFEDPTRAVGIRDHRPEDGFRRIHWKASARRQELQVKVYEPTASYNLIVFLNVATFARHWEGVKPLLLEQTIAVAASIASHGVEQRYLVGLMANGSIPHSDQSIKVLPSRRPDQLARVLEALAAVTSFTTSTIESLLLAESPRLPWGATLVIVTAIVTEDLLAALVRLHDVGRRLVLVSLEDDTPHPQLEGEALRPYSLPSEILVYHLPASDLPFDETLLGEPGDWAPEVAPPLRLTGGGG
jgi:uncharacterized protein (DUF58 family)